MRRRYLICGFFLIVIALYLAVGHILSKRSIQKLGLPPQNIAAKTVEFRTATGEKVLGWLSYGQPRAGVILLLHGVRSNRLQMLKRAEFLHAAGYGVLLIDLPAHGESGGKRITFGANESLGVTAALCFLHLHFPNERLGIIGVSLGAASTVLALQKPELSAVVLESMYPTIEDAVSDRLQIHLGKLGRWFTPVLLWQLPLYTGVNAEALQPERVLSKLGAPVLIASGDLDLHTRWEETERLFTAAASPKELWRVHGAAHIDLYEYASVEYQQRILNFFGKSLRVSP